jgi:hypothetical protein
VTFKGGFFPPGDENNPFYSGINTFGSHTTLITGGAVSSVWGWDTSAITITGGAVDYAYAENSAVVDISGGDVNTTVGNSGLIKVRGGNVGAAYATDISGGDVGDALATETAIINISGGSVTTAYAFSESTVSISGGTVGSAYSLDTATVNISGGSVTTAFAYGNSVTNITGGSVADLHGVGDGVFNLFGATLGANTVRLFENSILNIYGSQLALTLTGAGSDDLGDYTGYTLGGILQGGQSIDGIVFLDYADGLEVGDPNGGTGNLRFLAGGAAVTPEPGSVAFALTVGVPAVVIALRRKRLP